MSNPSEVASLREQIRNLEQKVQRAERQRDRYQWFLDKNGISCKTGEKLSGVS